MPTNFNSLFKSIFNKILSSPGHSDKYIMGETQYNQAITVHEFTPESQNLCKHLSTVCWHYSTLTVNYPTWFDNYRNARRHNPSYCNLSLQKSTCTLPYRKIISHRTRKTQRLQFSTHYGNLTATHPYRNPTVPLRLDHGLLHDRRPAPAEHVGRRGERKAAVKESSEI